MYHASKFDNLGLQNIEIIKQIYYLYNVNKIKIFLFFTLVLFITACGGGGGGGSASSPTAINFSETLSVTRGLVATYRDNGAGNNPDTYAEEIGFESELLFGGFNWSQNADTDGFSVKSDTLYSELDLNASLTTAHILSGPTTASASHTMTSTNYVYGYYDSSISANVRVTVAVPSDYPNQTWLYWDNSNYKASSDDLSINFAVTGKPLAYASLPASGTATYTGGMEGYFANTSSKYNSYNGHLLGKSNFSVDWSAQTISGSFTNITETVGSSTYSFNNLTMPSTSIGSSSYGSYGSFEGDLQGTGFTTNLYNAIHGTFFGSNAESIGGTWEIQNDGATGSGAGYFAAKKD